MEQVNKHSEINGPWVSELGYDQLSDSFSSSFIASGSDDVDRHRFAPELRAIFGPETGRTTRGIVAGDAVVCIDDVPTVCLVNEFRLESDPLARSKQLRDFCERLWNQNLARVLLVTGNDKLEVWSVDNPNADPQTYSLKEKRQAERAWSMSGLFGGEALRGRDGWFDPMQRVDKVLLDNISILVRELSENDLAPTEARRLIARLIFVTYLEDRGIVSDTYRSSKKVRPLFELVSERDRKGLCELVDCLRADFNGDFLSSEESDSDWAKLTDQSFSLLGDFLSRTTLRTGQASFWRYDFSQIPVELIAGIYETFLSGRDAASEEVALEGAKRNLGAYYTPRLLADWVVQLALADRDILSEKIFDGACGSGMLLTAAFRRIIRDYETQELSKGREAVADFATRQRLLLNQIYGGDIDEDACQLTAFSLYLALLSDLNPRDLSELRDGGDQLPTLSNNIRRGPEGNFFDETSERNNKGRFGVFLSNPPWRQIKANSSVATDLNAWRSRQATPRPHIPKSQIATAFALGAADTLEPYGRVALILPVTPFVSGDDTQRDFRSHLLGRYKIEKIINFSDMRRLIFSDAIHPFVVLIATARPQEKRFSSIELENFEYWTPKTDISLAFGRLEVYGGDRQSLPSNALLTNEPQLKTRYWGTDADINLLNRLVKRGRVRDLLKTEWISGKGFAKTDNDQRRSQDTWTVKIPDSMAESLFLDARELPKDLPVVPKQALRLFPYDEIARVPAEYERLFDGPRVLWPDGVHPARGVKAVYADQPFSVRQSFAVLASPKTEIGRLFARFLTAYFRSPMGVWLLSLLSSSVVSERPKLHIGEALDWPFWSLEDHPNPKFAKCVLTKIDLEFRRVEDSSDLQQPEIWNCVRPTVNRLVYSYFQLSENDIAMIEEFASLAGPALQPTSLKHNALLRPIREAPDENLMKSYSGALKETLSQWRDATGGKGSIQVVPWTGSCVPIGAAVLTLGNQEMPDKLKDDSVIKHLLQARMCHRDRPKDSLFTVPHVTAIEGNRIYLIKPLIARFWMRRCAIEDGNELAMRLQALSAK